jgi:glycosyltransferase involved in cell wall biosynthesis
VYHGIEVDRYAANPREGGEVPTLLAVGRLVPKKGLCYLVQAVGLLRRRGREVTLLVVGDGPERQRLERLAVEEGVADRVRFLGELPHEAVIPLYARGDILALPCVIDSSGDRDGIPNVLLEALASGMAVVSTPVSGIPEVVEEGRTGLLVPPADPAALADAIEALAADPALRRQLGEAGRDRVVQRFDIRRSPMAELFQRLAGVPAGKERR